MLNDWKYPFGIHYINKGIEIKNFINAYNQEHNINYQTEFETNITK